MKLPALSFDQVKSRFSALSKRERLIILAGLAALLYAVANSLVYQKQQTQIASLDTQLQADQLKLNRIMADIESIDRGTFPRERGLTLSKELAELRSKSEALDLLLASVKGKTPQIGEVIRGLIRTRHQRITLQSIKTIPAQLVIAQQSPESSAIYRHGLEINIDGSYLDVLAYLRSLEASIDGLFWSGLNVAADGKEISVRIKIYILSREAKPILA